MAPVVATASHFQRLMFSSSLHPRSSSSLVRRHTRWINSRKLARTTAITSTTAAAVCCYCFQPSVPLFVTAAWIMATQQQRSFNILANEKPLRKQHNVHFPIVREQKQEHPKSLLFSTKNIVGEDSSWNKHIKTDLEEQMTYDALNILQNAIDAVDPYTAVHSHFHRNQNTLYVGKNEQQIFDKQDQVSQSNEDDQGTSTIEKFDLDDYDDIVIVAFGKASSAMATAVVQKLRVQKLRNDDPEKVGNIKLSGLVICKDDHATVEEEQILSSCDIPIRYASHPVPDQRSADAATEVLELVKNSASERTLVICCISGGGSALFCKPRPPLTLQDLQDTNSVLLSSGLTIQEMNIIRKRLEEGKGGRLAEQCSPSTVITLVLSDVLGDPLDLIASGPTVPDTSTSIDAWNIVQRRQQLQQEQILDKDNPASGDVSTLASCLPTNVQKLLQQGAEESLLEDKEKNTDNDASPAAVVLVGNNELAVTAAAAKADTLGYQPIILGTQVEGEAKEVSRVYIAMALYLQQQQEKLQNKNMYSVASSFPVALIAGGETTVSIPSSSTGKGGRNQELALSAALQMESLGMRNVVLGSIGTDGTDGPTDAAGAIVDGTTVSSSIAQAQDAMERHDSYTYFGQLSNGFQEETCNEDNNNRPVDDDHGGLSPLIKTGPTGTNVADVCVTLIHPHQK